MSALEELAKWCGDPASSNLTEFWFAHDCLSHSEVGLDLCRLGLIRIGRSILARVPGVVGHHIVLRRKSEDVCGDRRRWTAGVGGEGVLLVE